MRNDFAALIPPFVVAVAFIVGVAALLRREMAPRLRRRARADSSADMPRTGAAGSSGRQQPAQPDQPADGSAGADTGDAGGAVSGGSRGGTADARSSDPVAQDRPPGS